MGPITYSLCQKSIIGVAFWLTGLCAFPPLIEPTEVSLAAPGLILRNQFQVPVQKSYLLTFRFFFPTVEDRLKDELVGNMQSHHCLGETPYEMIPKNQRLGLGIPIPVRVLVRAESGNEVLVDKTFNSLCANGHATNDKSREIGRISLAEGRYYLEVYNLESHHAFDRLKVFLAFVSGDAK